MKVVRCIIPQTSDSSNIYVHSFFLSDSSENIIAKGYGYNYHIFPFKDEYDNILNHPEKELINRIQHFHLQYFQQPLIL